jgi:hypothetical protein
VPWVRKEKDYTFSPHCTRTGAQRVTFTYLYPTYYFLKTRELYHRKWVAHTSLCAHKNGECRKWDGIRKALCTHSLNGALFNHFRFPTLDILTGAQGHFTHPAGASKGKTRASYSAYLTRSRHNSVVSKLVELQRDRKYLCLCLYFIHLSQ